MAYKPISQISAGGGYVPIGQTKPQGQTPSLQSFFPAQQKIQTSSFRERNPVAVPQTTEQRRNIVETDKERGTSISQNTPSVSLLTRGVRKLPFSNTIERDVLKPVAKVRDFFIPSQSDYMVEATEEDPTQTLEQVKERAQALMLKDGFVDVNGATFSPTDSMPVSGRIKAGALAKVGVKRLIRRVLNAETETAATKLAKQLTSNEKEASEILGRIIGANTETKAGALVRSLEKQASSKSKYTPIKSQATDTGLLRDSFVKRFESVKPVNTSSKAGGGGDILRSTPVPKSIVDLKKTPNPTVKQLNEALEAIRVSGRKADDLALELREFTKNQPAPFTQRAGASDITAPVKTMATVKMQVAKLKQSNPSLAKQVEVSLNKVTAQELVQKITKLPTTKLANELSVLTKPQLIEEFGKIAPIQTIIEPQQNTTKGIFASALENLRDPARRQQGSIGGVPEGFPKLKSESVSSVNNTTDAVLNGAMAKYRKTARKPVTADNDLAEAAKKAETPGQLKKLTGELLTPISSRLGRINPELKVQLRKFENSVAQQTHLQNVEIKPLLDATKRMTAQDQAIFDIARKNGDSEVIDAIGTKYNIQQELTKTRNVMDNLFDRAKAVGLDVEYRKDYFPRSIKNPQKFLAYLRGREDWSSIRKAVEEAAEKKGVKYTDLDPEEVSGIVNTFIRGYGNKIELSGPGATKARTIEVLDDELNEFYESADSSLAGYIVRMNDEIEGRKFFGKRPKGEPVTDIGAEDSIGSYVFDLIEEGKILPNQEEEVSDILRSRFHRGKMNGALDVYKNAEYISTMGSVISAVTQLGDIAFSLYDNGIYHTARGVKKSFSKNRITKEDLGVEQITQEFANATASGKALEKVFRVVGLNKMDRLGKETLVNGNMSKLQAFAKNGDERLDVELGRWFDAEEAQVVKEQFRQGSLTEETKLVLFSRLLDFQPVAKSEMPQKYLEMPNGRIFYMLKSFTIKQFDVFRREAIDDIVSGDKTKTIKGMKNLGLLAGAFVMANATSDEIKDQILGRDTPMADRVVDNMWRLVGASKYDVYKARQEGFGTTVMKKVLFPASIIDRGSKDVSNVLNDKRYERGPLEGEKYKSESVQTIPVAGKLYYWWFGRGAQKQEFKESIGSTEEGGLPKLPKIPTAGGSEGQLPKLPKI